MGTHNCLHRLQSVTIAWSVVRSLIPVTLSTPFQAALLKACMIGRFLGWQFFFQASVMKSLSQNRTNLNGFSNLNNIWIMLSRPATGT